MARLIVAGLTALLISGASPTYAQPSFGSQPQAISEADLKWYTEQRIAVVKAALELRADQGKYWPAIEEAIRARAASRHQRLAKLAAMYSKDREPNPIEILQERADALIQRGATLKKLTDAWQPLYPTLDDRQQLRLRFLAAYVLREMRNAIVSRRMQSLDEEEEY